MSITEFNNMNIDIKGGEMFIDKLAKTNDYNKYIVHLRFPFKTKKTDNVEIFRDLENQLKECLKQILK